MGGVTSLAIPESATVAGLPVALCAIERLVERLLSTPVGVKVTVIVWAVPPALTVKGAGETVNIVVSAVPTRAMDEIVNAAVPVFDTVNVCVPGVPPMLTVPNDNEEDD